MIKKRRVIPEYSSECEFKTFHIHVGRRRTRLVNQRFELKERKKTKLVKISCKYKQYKHEKNLQIEKTNIYLHQNNQI